MSGAIGVVRTFVERFEAGDVEGLKAVMREDFAGHITTADGGVRTVGRDGYLESVRALDVSSANLRLDVPNLVETEPGKVLVMVEIHAERGGRVLHNFSGQLFTVVDGVIAESWMVEAQPAASDRFWSA